MHNKFTDWKIFKGNNNEKLKIEDQLETLRIANKLNSSEEIGNIIDLGTGLRVEIKNNPELESILLKRESGLNDEQVKKYTDLIAKYEKFREDHRAHDAKVDEFTQGRSDKTEKDLMASKDELDRRMVELNLENESLKVLRLRNEKLRNPKNAN